mmetsp:Transcript_124999/g.400485  ORF Transcript_124999/g.400485 Transcript_124999/m.400485 type:complete len:487 (+) Transcript_124999:188-1648(+)
MAVVHIDERCQRVHVRVLGQGRRPQRRPQRQDGGARVALLWGLGLGHALVEDARRAQRHVVLHAHARPVGRGQPQRRQPQFREPLVGRAPGGRLEADGLRQPRAAAPTCVDGPRVPEQQRARGDADPPRVPGPALRQALREGVVTHFLDLAVVHAGLPVASQLLVAHHRGPDVAVAAGPDDRGGVQAVRPGRPDVEHTLVDAALGQALAHVAAVLVHVRAELVGGCAGLPLGREEGDVQARHQRAALPREEAPEGRVHVPVPPRAPGEPAVRQAALQHEAGGRSEVPHDGGQGEAGGAAVEEALVNLPELGRGLPKGLRIHEVEEVQLEVLLKCSQLLFGLHHTNHDGETIFVENVLEAFAGLGKRHRHAFKLLPRQHRRAVLARGPGVPAAFCCRGAAGAGGSRPSALGAGVGVCGALTEHPALRLACATDCRSGLSPQLCSQALEETIHPHQARLNAAQLPPQLGKLRRRRRTNSSRGRGPRQG